MKVYYVKLSNGSVSLDLMFSSYSALLQHFSANDLAEYNVEIKPFDLIDAQHQNDFQVVISRKEARERIDQAIKQHFEYPHFT